MDRGRWIKPGVLYFIILDFDVEQIYNEYGEMYDPTMKFPQLSSGNWTLRD